MSDPTHAVEEGFDPKEWVAPKDVAALLGDAWQIEVDEVRDRAINGGAGAHHHEDIVLRARRKAR